MTRDAVLLLIVVGILVALGVVTLFSASAVMAEASTRYGDAYYFLKKQLIWLLIALMGLVAAARIPTVMWRRWAGPLLGITVLLLCLVYVPGVGATLNKARRWLSFGGLSFQPSELAKLTLVLFLSAYAIADATRVSSFRRGLLPMCAVTAVVCGLVLEEPDIGTAAFMALSAAVAMVIAGVRLSLLLQWGAVVVVAGGGLVMWRMEHFRQRLEGWLNYEAHPCGYQLRQSLIALGAGGWFGEGLGRGTQKLYFLPEPHSDFVFAILGEELGYLGCLSVLMLFAATAVIGWRIARRSATPFGFLVAFLVTFQLVFQAALNMAVVTGLMPTKGIPLPFFSAGGSSLCITLVGIGILVRISRESPEAQLRSVPWSSPAESFTAISAP